jgi:BirA family biotin operon repressor/biotin-[acetyl-CoA-carboxylase] ligase
LAQHSASNSIGEPFIELPTVESTNKYAMALVHAGMTQHGQAIFTHTQTAGKGQRGKSWASEPGSNIALSIVIRPEPLRINEQFYLSAAVALAVHQFFSKYAGEDETKIKWPNDLYWRDRKAGGILIESVIGSNQIGEQQIKSGEWRWAVIGIGININQTTFSQDLFNPVSVKQITGKSFDPVVLAKELCNYMQKEIDLLFSGKKDETIKRYNQYLYKRGELVKLKKDSRVFETSIQSVSSNGQLITSDAIEHEFNFGEVEWAIEKNK